MASLRWSPEVLRYLRRKYKRNRHGDPWSFHDVEREVAAVLGRNLGSGRVSEYERGVYTPRADMVAALAEVFGVEPGVFFVRASGPMTEAEARAHLIARGVIG